MLNEMIREVERLARQLARGIVAVLLFQVALLGQVPLAQQGQVVTTFIPSEAAVPEGIAVQLILPETGRCGGAAPVAIFIPGADSPSGIGPAQLPLAEQGVILLQFAFPGGGRPPLKSGGTYDQRGEACIAALRDVILFAAGRLPDAQGRTIQDLVGPGLSVATDDVGLVGWSNGGNIATVVLAQEELPVAWLVTYETPAGDLFVTVSLGGILGDPDPRADADGDAIPWDDGRCPHYVPGQGLDLSGLSWDPEAVFSSHPRRPAARGVLYLELDGRSGFAPAPGGRLDRDRNGQVDPDEDWPLNFLEVEIGGVRKRVYPLEVTRRAVALGLLSRMEAAGVPVASPEEAEAFWRLRDMSYHYGGVAESNPDLAVIVFGSETDHVQALPAHDHVLSAYEGFLQAGVRFVRLNPDAAYVEAQAGRPGPYPDHPAGARFDISASATEIGGWMEPEGAATDQVYIAAAALELCDRVRFGDWSPDLAAVLAGAPAALAQASFRPGRRGPAETVLLLPHDVDRLESGNTLITDGGDPKRESGSRVIEVDPAGRVVWSFEEGLSFAHSAELSPDGTRVLITDTGHDRVIEVGRKSGEILWDSSTIALSDGSRLRYPNDAHYLDPDRFLITDRDNHRAVVIDREGSVLWQFGETGVPGSDLSHLRGPHNADPLPTGGVIISDSENGRILEVSPDGKVVRSYAPTGPEALHWPRDADRLPNGNTLIVDSKGDRVIEVTPSGEVVWEYAVGMPYDADRLENGNTLLTDTAAQRVLEVTPEGRIVWSFPQAQEALRSPAAPGGVSQAPEVIVTHIPSAAGSIAVKIVPPERPRYPEGAPVVIEVGGFVTRGFLGFAEAMRSACDHGFVHISFLWPGASFQGLTSTGTFDFGGEQCLLALRDVARFACGLLVDEAGRTIQDLLPIPVLTDDVGLYTFSHPGIVATVMLALYGDQVPGVRFFVGHENPTCDALTALDLGYHERGRPVVNPTYDYPEDFSPEWVHPDYSAIAYDFTYGVPYLDLNGNGRYDPEAEYAWPRFGPMLFDKRHYSVAVIRALWEKGIFAEGTWPDDLATPEEAEENWQLRSTPAYYPLLSGRDLAVMLVFGERDHVQPTPDKPHIHQGYLGFRGAGLWVRLNPDRAYVLWAAPELTGAPDNPANHEPADWMESARWGYPVLNQDVRRKVGLAALAEMADRVHFDVWGEDLDGLLVGEVAARPEAEPLRERPSLGGIAKESAWVPDEEGHRIYVSWWKPEGKGPFPAVVFVPAIGPGVPALGSPAFRELAQDGFVVASFNPEGRGQPGEDLSEGEETCQGPNQQEDLKAVVEYLAALPYVDRGNIGVMSFSGGSLLAGCALGRWPELPVAYWVDGEGPHDGSIILRDPCGHPNTRVDPSPENVAFWAERSPVRFIGNFRGRYLRVQAEIDHAQGRYYGHALAMVEAALAGGVPWVRVNGENIGNPVNARYPLDDPSRWPVWIPGRLRDQPGGEYGVLARYAREMAALVAAEGEGAEAASMPHFSRVSGEPVLGPGEAPWEGVDVLSCEVLWDEEANVFRMWYTGFDGERYAIGYAESRDGISWERYPGNPVLSSSGTEWDREGVGFPAVVEVGDRYYMYFTLLKHARAHRDTAIGLAVSEDGVHWERVGPVLLPGTAGTYDARAAVSPEVFITGDGT